jgi:glutamyl-tRNA(Gln) amidotransferase subunit E
MVIVWGSEDDVKTASDEIIIRAKEATIGIPGETRQALSDGTNGFERILPGADRMYPDTDLPPQSITQERLDKIKTWLPEKFWERQRWYKILGVPDDVIDELSISPYAMAFKKSVEEWKVNPSTAAVVLIQYPKRLKKEGRDVGILSNEVLEIILKFYADDELPRDAILSVMRNTIEMGLFSNELIPKPISEEQLDLEIKTALKELEKLKLRGEENKEYVLMGMLMRKLRGRISAVIVAGKVGFKREGRAND